MKHWQKLAYSLSLALLIVLAACTPEPSLSVSFLTPQQGVTVDKSLEVQLEVRGAADSVELFVDEQKLGLLSASYSYTWDTSALEAGSYTLKALAKQGSTEAHDSRLITVEHLAPLLSLSPCAPDEAALTNSTLSVSASVSDTGIQTLELLLDGTVQARLEAPFSYVLDSTTLSEGSHDLKVRTSHLGQTFESAICTFAVDRTAPTITQQSPEPNSDNASLLDPIEIQFSEPLAETYSPTNVKLTDADGKSLKTSLTLEGATLSLQLNEAPALPATLKLELTDLRDLAGNALSASWQWQVPQWQQLGQLKITEGKVSTYSAIAVDGDNSPVVAWLEAPLHDEAHEHDHGNLGILPESALYVARWNGSGWENLGGKLSTNRAYPPSLVIDSQNRPIIAWHEAMEHEVDPEHEQHTQVFVNRWNGSSWESLGILNLNPKQNAAYPRLAIAGDKLFAAWFEDDGNSSNVYAAAWSGSSWEQRGSALDLSLGQDAAFPAIAASSDDHMIVTWYEDNRIPVKRWNGSSWEQLGETLEHPGATRAMAPTVALDLSGNAVVSWFELEHGQFLTYVKQWHGSSWQQLGGATNVFPSGDATYPYVNVSPKGEIVSAWYEFHAPTDYVVAKRWNGSSWGLLSDGMNLFDHTYAYYTALALDKNGIPILAWCETTTSNYEPDYGANVYVARYNELP